ncbi:MAG: O-antigen ligase family protein [Actinomycetota bacterium]|nr:O-antigen ligase family protein [Actinomycetota bacterium]
MPPVRLLPSWAWWLLVLPACLGVAVLTTMSVQLAASAVAVACVVGVYLASRTAGIAGMWLLWLLLPAVRRMFGISEGFESANPLAAAPFAATGIVAALELSRARLGPRAKRILFLAGAGFVFGVPLGILAAPDAAAFALVAYLAAICSFAIGYREPRDRPLVLVLVLAVAAAPIAIYAVLQILAPLTQWDQVWLDSVRFSSIGDKEDGTLRAFGTLNAPGTLAVVLGLAVVCLLSAMRLNVVQVAALLAVLAGLALTLARGVWVSLAFALIVLLALAPRQVGRRVLVVGAVAVVCVPLFVAGNPASTTVADRASTFTALGDDRSANARIATPQNIVPVAVREPLGLGIGQAGEASRLGDNYVLRATDNAFLSVLLQAGPVGLVLVLSAVALGVSSAVRNVRRRKAPNDLAVLGCVALLGALMVTADAFYGVSGVALWYMLGYAVKGDGG